MLPGLLGDKLSGASIWSTQLPSKIGMRATAVTPMATQLQLIKSPLNIHHAEGDQTTLFAGSVTLAAQLTQLSKPNNLYSYASDSHLFTDDNLTLGNRSGYYIFSSHNGSSIIEATNHRHELR